VVGALAPVPERIGLTRWLLYRCDHKWSALQEHIASVHSSLPLLVAQGLTTQRKPTGSCRYQLAVHGAPPVITTAVVRRAEMRAHDVPGVHWWIGWVILQFGPAAGAFRNAARLCIGCVAGRVPIIILQTLRSVESHTGWWKRLHWRGTRSRRWRGSGMGTYPARYSPWRPPGVSSSPTQTRPREAATGSVLPFRLGR
jgi:hypothetical protein